MSALLRIIRVGHCGTSEKCQQRKWTFEHSSLAPGLGYSGSPALRNASRNACFLRCQCRPLWPLGRRVGKMTEMVTNTACQVPMETLRLIDFLLIVLGA